MINCVIIMYANIRTNHTLNTKDSTLLNTLVECLMSGEEKRTVFSFITLIKCLKIEVLGSSLDRQTCRENWQSFSCPKKPHHIILTLVIKRYKWTGELIS